MQRVLSLTRGAMRKALVASFAAHGVLLVLALPITRRAAAHAHEAHETVAVAEVLEHAADRGGAGETLELPAAGAGKLYDVSLDAIPAQEAPVKEAPAPAPIADPPKAPPAKAESVPPPAEPAVVKPPPARPRRAESASSAKPDDAPAPPKRAQKKRRAATEERGEGDLGAKGAASHGGGSGGAGRRGGADLDDPRGIRDLARAISHMIPAACQADEAWAALAVGEGGSIDVTFHVDETGHIRDWKVAGGAPPKHLADLVRRTLALIDSSTFGLRAGSLSAGTETIRLRAIVSDVPVTQEGGVPGLQWDYDDASRKGWGAFTQPSGRHVEVRVAVRGIEPAP